jgi:hypothetical protein
MAAPMRRVQVALARAGARTITVDAKAVRARAAS